MVVANALRFGSVEAVVDGGDRVTFAELERRMTEAIGAFMAAGVSPGDRVAIWAPNSAQWIVWALGILGAGGVVVPLNTRFKGPEAAYVLERSRSRMLLTVDEFLGAQYADLLAPHRSQLADLGHLVVAGERPAGTMSWDELVGSAGDRAAAAARLAAVGPDDLSDLIFTSGTTGHPKGVMVTHGQSLAVYRAWSDTVGLRARDRYLIVYPFFHCAGYKSGWLSCLLRGATAFPRATFDVDEVLRCVAREQITVLPGTPTMLGDILDHPRRADFDLSSLRLTVTGAAVVPETLVRRLGSEMSFENVVTGYGLTETCGTAAMCRHDDDVETIARFSGRALPETELAVVDDNGKEVARGAPGEVVARGYHVMQGYFDDPEATSEAIDTEGWLHTGDIGVMDDRGYVAITDRKKDMFIVGGFNAYPAEIEGVLVRHPSVSQAAVVGVPDARMGEVGFAYLIPRPEHEIDAEAFLEWCRREMANYKVPRHLRVVDSFPLNPTGKVLKYELRARAALETSGARA